MPGRVLVPPPGADVPRTRWDVETQQWVDWDGPAPPIPADWDPWREPPPNAQPFDAARVGANIRGRLDLAATGATLGLWPHVAAAVGGGIPGIASEKGFAGGYQSELEGINANMDRIRSTAWDAPYWEMGGALAPAAFTAGATLPATGARIASRGVLPAMGRTIKTLVGGGVLGGVGAAAYGFAEGTGDLRERAQQAIGYAPYGFVFGAATPAALRSAGALTRAAKAVFPSRAARTTGPLSSSYSEEAIKLASRERRDVARELFDELDNSGFRVSRTEVDDALENILGEFTEALGENPNANRLLNDIIGRTAQHPGGVPIGTIERWRQDLSKRARDLWAQNNGAEAELVSSIIDALDDQILALTEYQPARAAWLSSIRLGSLETAAVRAADRAGKSNGSTSYEEAFRSQLQRIKDGRQWNKFSQEQKDAITTAIRDSGPLSNIETILSTVFGSGIRRIMINVLGTGASVATGNPLFAFPAAADAAARISRVVSTQNNLTRMAELGGVPQRPPPSAGEAFRRVNSLTRLAAPAVAASYSNPPTPGQRAYFPAFFGERPPRPRQENLNGGRFTIYGFVPHSSLSMIVGASRALVSSSASSLVDRFFNHSRNGLRSRWRSRRTKKPQRASHPAATYKS